jgi:hypothetical protein
MLCDVLSYYQLFSEKNKLRLSCVKAGVIMGLVYVYGHKPG